MSLTLALVPVWTTTNCRHCFEHSCKHCWYHRTYMALSRIVTNRSQPNPSLVRLHGSNRLHLPTNSPPTFCLYLVDTLVARYFASGERKRSHDSSHGVVRVLRHLRFPELRDGHLIHSFLADLANRVLLSSRFPLAIPQRQRFLRNLSSQENRHHLDSRLIRLHLIFRDIMTGLIIII